jgi:hypothetical protein
MTHPRGRGDKMDSILTSIKKLLGIESDVTNFDGEITLHINSVLMILNQLGIGEVLVIEDSSSTWSDFLGQATYLELVKSYTYLKVRILFDPPTVGALVKAMEDQINQFEYRLCLQAETETQPEGEEDP